MPGSPEDPAEILKALKTAEDLIKGAIKAVKKLAARRPLGNPLSPKKDDDGPEIRMQPCWKTAYQQDDRIRRTEPNGRELTHAQVYVKISERRIKPVAPNAAAHAQYVRNYRRAISSSNRP